MRLTRSIALASLTCMVIPGPAVLGEGGGWSEGSGADLRNYAPPLPVDYTHMQLALDIRDMNEPVLEGSQRLTFTVRASPLRVLTLDAMRMKIRSVSVPDHPNEVSYDYDGERLAVTFDPPLAPGTTATLETNYTVHDPPQGLIWTPESEAWPDRPAQLHTQGQPQTNSWWFPCHDFPNERLTTELIVAVPRGFTVSSNGRLEAERAAGWQQQFHWVQDKDHVNYLVTLVVGKFDVVDVAPKGSRVPMPVYVPPGEGEKVQQTYGRTAEMLEVFEERFDEPYPWDRYAQLVVWNFGAGGMENTSATTMFDTAVLDRQALEDGNLEGLISHELAHQWFGDLITCNTWAHIWLNEGWATYSTHLWYEARDGFQDGYIAHLYGTLRGVAGRDQLTPDGPIHQPMVSLVYEHPWEVFRRKANPYPKGASILHMLRMKLGEEVFFDAVAEYIDRFKFKTTETDDFRGVLEDVSGQSLEQFFIQWCERPGTPDLKVKAKWHAESCELRINVEQQQRIDADHPAFAIDLPIEVYLNEDASPDDAIRLTIPVRGRSHERSIPLDIAPAMVLVDPDLSILMTVEVDAPAQWLRRQLTAERSVASRLDAAAMLATHNSAETRDALESALSDEREHYTVRKRAAQSLNMLHGAEALVRALDSGIDDARVRAAALEGLNNATSREAVNLLARHASDSEPSYACRAAALTALGKVGSDKHMPIFEAGLAAESQHDKVREGAIKGLREVDTPEALELVIPFTEAGNLSRLRPQAIEAVGSLGHHDPDRAFEVLSELLQDREARSVRAAGQALVVLEHKKGLHALQTLARVTRDPSMRFRAEEWHDKLAAALSGDSNAESSRRDVARLRRELDELRSRIDEKFD